jgi:hypothetical protein
LAPTCITQKEKTQKKKTQKDFWLQPESLRKWNHVESEFSTKLESLRKERLRKEKPRKKTLRKERLSKESLRKERLVKESLRKERLRKWQHRLAL